MPRKTNESKQRGGKRTRKQEAEPEPIEEEVVEVVEEEVVNSKASRANHHREVVFNSFDELLHIVETEIAHLRETKGTGVKFLRSVGKRLKTLRTQTARALKTRQRSQRKANTNSGFLKPVKISKEMAKFTGWNANDLKSRVDVTKYICNYIREHDLQNPEDRRQILADNKLSKLLKYDSRKDKEPLTYYRIQTYMKPHFIKEEA